MDAKTLRKAYFDYFRAHGHQLIPSASLIPENDPTVLFTTAGMHPLVPYLLGQKHPAGNRLVNVQKCIRTQDIEDVGDDWHCTFFEMMGYWSLGDYFKEEAIALSYGFITEVLGIDSKRLAVTVFRGEPGVPADTESIEHWKKHGIPDERIFRLGREDNFWGPAGMTGPCGPDTEMFVITRDSCGLGKPDCSPACKCGRYVEIGNDVFMEYEKLADGSLRPLPQRNVDFGMGLVRVTSILGGAKSVYESNIFRSSMDYLREIAPNVEERKRRIIADHLQTAVFAIGDGASPSNIGAGYIVRRILRRTYRIANQYNIDKGYIAQIVERVAAQYQDEYPEMYAKREAILAEILIEEEKFVKALGQGIKHLEKELDNLKRDNLAVIPGRVAFNMFETYGFPVEVTEEIAGERGISVDIDGYQKAYAEHQEKSRAGSEKLFKGGLADHTETTTKLHTATHMMHAALRQVLGTHVEQRGSNITAERLRFDFSHPDKMTKEQVEQVEKIVNEQIDRQLEVTVAEMTLDEARAQGAIGLFEDRYGVKVKVYSVGDFSKEVCGGPHVTNTRELGRFKINKEEASSRGVRRIKATLEAR